MVRTVLILFAIAVIFFGYNSLADWLIDPDIGSTDTAGWIVAVEQLPDGSRAVMFTADGEKVNSKGYEPGTLDQDPRWRPDGNRVFFVSNRDDNQYNIYRWNPDKNAVVQRSTGSRAKSTPYYGPPDYPNLLESGMIVSAGYVMDYNQRDGTLRQLLPPIGRERTVGDEEGGAAGQFDTQYRSIGSSFKDAKWGADRRVIYAVMRRDAQMDEVFVVNLMKPIGLSQPGPIPLFAGKRIEFDVGPNGTAVVAVEGFALANPNAADNEFIKEGRVLLPWRNCLFAITVDKDGAPQSTPMFFDRPETGVMTAPITEEFRRQHDVPSDIQGLAVQQVAPDSAADRIGISVGDVLMRINGQPATDDEAVFNALREVFWADTAEFEFYKSAGDDPGVKTVQYRFWAEPGVFARQPAISPDGRRVVVAIGRGAVEREFSPGSLFVMPIKEAGMYEGQAVVNGEVAEPRWHPSGTTIVYLKAGPAGDRQIYTINVDGTGEQNVSGGTGNYMSPSFSPQKRKED